MPHVSLRVWVGLSFAVGLLTAQPAFAACHAFTISASPSSVAEGGSTTITVERDADVAPSSVRVRTVDGTAKAGSDYVGVAERTIQFTQGTEQSFVVATRDDTAAEGPETFRVELIEGSGGGCAANPDFVYGPPATVTIGANDQRLPTTTPTTAPPTTRPPATRSRSPQPVLTSKPATRTSAPSVTTTPVTTTPPATTTAPETALTESPSPAAVADPGDAGGGIPVVAIALVAIVAAAALGYLGYRGLRA